MDGRSSAARRQSAGRRAISRLLAVFVLTATVSACTAEGETTRPDIVLIVTDDQRWDTLAEMPGLTRTVGEPGVTFDDAFVVNPLCCPSRASILTGAYSHTTGIYTNFPPDGGFRAFDDESTLATWLDDAGYRTALIGKYFNGYEDPSYIPPGWDRWNAFMHGHPLYYDYTMSVDGEPETFGAAPEDYSTDVLAGMAERFIDETSSSEPLFLYLAPSAPHQPQLLPPRDAAAKPRTTFRPGPNIREPDVSDKPAYIRALPRGHVEGSLERWTQQVLTLRAVDDLVVRTVDALSARGRLDDTLIIFMSDNGTAVGEHRWQYKLTPYEESIRIPMVMRYDPITRGTSTGAIVANVDIAPTIAEVAGVEAPGSEGVSLVDLLRGDVSRVRSELLIEHLQYRSPPHADPPTYCALRTTRRLFVRYATGEEELYDLRADPYQLRNLAGDPASQATLDRLRRSTKRRCQPVPPGFSW